MRNALLFRETTISKQKKSAMTKYRTLSEKKATVDDRNPTANKLAAPSVPVPYGFTTPYHSCGSVLAFRSLLTLCAELRVAPLLKLFCQVQQSHYRPSESRARLCLAWASAWLGLGLGLAWLIGEPIRSLSLVTGVAAWGGAPRLERLGAQDDMRRLPCRCQDRRLPLCL